MPRERSTENASLLFNLSQMKTLNNSCLSYLLLKSSLPSKQYSCHQLSNEQCVFFPSWRTSEQRTWRPPSRIKLWNEETNPHFLLLSYFLKVSNNPDLGVGRIASPPPQTFPTELCDYGSTLSMCKGWSQIFLYERILFVSYPFLTYKVRLTFSLEQLS